jgi:type I restriction enzyme M protein
LEEGALIMAKRICFISKPFENQIFEELEVNFEYFTGFALSQKQKSIHSMHSEINKIDKSLQVLEISTKSNNSIGVALSAFNLKFHDIKSDTDYPIENIFQSSKVFQKGGPYTDLLAVNPRDAKRDDRLKSSGSLIHFTYDSILWDLEPKSMFYDWIYINSLSRNKLLSKKILEYNAFTDIEFNHQKSINCQARSAAIFVSLSKLGILEEILNDKEKFRNVYNYKFAKNNIQMSIFDD